MPIESKCLKLKARQSNYMVNHFQLQAAGSRVLDAKYMGHCCRKVHYCLWKRQRTHTHGKCDKSKREGCRRKQLLKAVAQILKNNYKCSAFLLLCQSFISAHVDQWSLCICYIAKVRQKWLNMKSLILAGGGQLPHNGNCPWGVNASKVAAGL